MRCEVPVRAVDADVETKKTRDALVHRIYIPHPTFFHGVMTSIMGTTYTKEYVKYPAGSTYAGFYDVKSACVQPMQTAPNAPPPPVQCSPNQYKAGDKTLFGTPDLHAYWKIPIGSLPKRPDPMSYLANIGADGDTVNNFKTLLMPYDPSLSSDALKQRIYEATQSGNDGSTPGPRPASFCPHVDPCVPAGICDCWKSAPNAGDSASSGTGNANSTLKWVGLGAAVVVLLLCLGLGLHAMSSKKRPNDSLGTERFMDYDPMNSSFD